MFFFEHESDESNEFLGCDPVYIRGRLLPFGQWVFDKSRGHVSSDHTFVL